MSLFKPRQKTPELSLTIDDGGFQVKSEIKTTYIQWIDIVKLTVYKIDLLATDLICLDVATKTGKVWRLHEEQEGWTDVTTVMNSILKLDNTWFTKVTLPAFQRNEVLIYQNGTTHI